MGASWLAEIPEISGIPAAGKKLHRPIRGQPPSPHPLGGRVVGGMGAGQRCVLSSGAVAPNLLREALVAIQAIAVGAFAELQFIGLRRSAGALAA
jgi:hypothetical protein